MLSLKGKILYIIKNVYDAMINNEKKKLLKKK